VRFEWLRLYHFAAAQAGSADADTLGGLSHASVHRAQVYVPAPLGHVVSVADAVARLRLLAANFTLLCHDYSRKRSVLLAKTFILADIPNLDKHQPRMGPRTYDSRNALECTELGHKVTAISVLSVLSAVL
jgi:hypothetical protein